jgi:hypothetical protein
VTFLDLQNLVALWVDDVNFGRHSQSSIQTYLNNALYEVQRKLIKAHDAYYYTCSYTSLVANQVEYILPDDFLALHDIWLVLSGTAPNEETLPLEYIAPSERHNFITQSTTPTNFWIKQDRVMLVPPPDSALTLEILYSYLVDPMSASSDVPDVPTQFHEYIAIIAAYNCYLRDDKVPALLKEKRMNYEALLEANEKRIQNRSRYIILVD